MEDVPSGLKRGTGDQTQAGLYKRIAKGLAKQPAYLLVFGIAALFGLGGLASFGKAVATDDKLWGLLGFASFVVAMIAAVVVIFRVDKGGTQKVRPPVLSVPFRPRAANPRSTTSRPRACGSRASSGMYETL